MAFTITPTDLTKSFVTYRKDLVQVPMLAMNEALQHMSVRTGIRYKEYVSQIGGKFQIGNYKKDKKGNGAVTIKGRAFETFFGNIVEPIDPNALYQTIWGSNVTKGEGLKNVPAALQVCAYMMKQVGENLLLNLFTAKHDASNYDSTAKFFNGFKSIVEADITAGEVSEAKKNLKEGSASISESNAEDVIKEFYWSREPQLRQQKLKLFLSDMAYHYYTEAYQAAHGALPYNTAYDKKTLEGASNVEIVPLACVPDDFMVLTPKSNIYALFNQKTEDETFIVERSLDNHYDVDFLCNMFFGTQFESVDPGVFSVWQKKAAVGG